MKTRTPSMEETIGRRLYLMGLLRLVCAAAACIFSLMVSMKEASPPGKEATSCFFMGGYIFSIIHIMSPVFTAPESSRAARTALSPYSPAWTAHTAATIMPTNKLLIMDGV